MMNLGLAGMGDTIASHMVTLAAFRGAQAIETGADRNMFDGEFGNRSRRSSGELYDWTWTSSRSTGPTCSRLRTSSRPTRR